MYHTACRAEFQPFNRLYSQLTFFRFLYNTIRRTSISRIYYPTCSFQSGLCICNLRSKQLSSAFRVISTIHIWQVFFFSIFASLSKFGVAKNSNNKKSQTFFFRIIHTTPFASLWKVILSILILLESREPLQYRETSRVRRWCLQHR